MSVQKLLYLSQEDVQNTKLEMTKIIEALDQMFLEKGHGRVEMPPKPGIHPQPDAFIHAMPAYIPSIASAGIKWVSGYPENIKKGLPYITGLLILNDPQTGIPYCIMDCTWLTAKRTGAATAVAARYLARPDSSTVGIIACGVQGRSNLEALACEFKLTKVKAFDLYPQTAERFASEMSQTLNLEIEVVSEPKQAVTGLDLVVTSGPILKTPKPVIQADWLDEGAFASLVDFDSYWCGSALAQADKIATDDLSQMAYYREKGYFSQTPEPYADLGQIVTSQKPGRLSPNERTLAINLGLALDDMATAPLIYQLAIDKGLGVLLSL